MLAIMSSMLVVGSASSRNQTDNPGPIIAVAPQPPGHPLTDNTIRLVDRYGNDLGTVPFDQPGQVTPTTLAGTALIRSLGGLYALIDLDSLAVTPLDFTHASPGAVTPQSFQFVQDRGQRFALFGDQTSLQAWIVDLSTGESVLLGDLIDDPSFRVLSAAIDLGDRLLTFSDGQQAFLLVLAPDQTPVPVDKDPVLAAVPSENGEAVFYHRKRADGGTDIVRLDLQADTREIIASGSPFMNFTLFPGDRLAYSDNGEVWLLESSSNARQLGQFGNAARAISMTSDGSAILVWHDDVGADAWSVVDLASGKVTDLPALAGMNRLDGSLVQDFALFSAAANGAPGTPGAAYISLELRTGTTLSLLTQDSSDIYSVNPISSENGRFHLIQAISPPLGRLWLTDGATGVASLIATSPGAAAGALARNGCCLAVSVFDTIGEGRQGTVTITDLATGQAITSLADVILLGWAS